VTNVKKKSQLESPTISNGIIFLLVGVGAILFLRQFMAAQVPEGDPKYFREYSENGLPGMSRSQNSPSIQIQGENGGLPSTL